MNKSKAAAAVFGIICIALVGILAFEVVNYTSMINDKNTTIANKDTQISDVQNQENQIQSWLDANRTEYQNYASSHSHLNSEYDSLQNIANLNEQQSILNQYTINQGAGTHTLVATFQANYAGYLYITLTSTTTNAYVIVEYWYQGRLFSVQKTLGTSGEAFVCLLPSSVAIYAGNSNYYGIGATHTITATYHY